MRRDASTPRAPGQPSQRGGVLPKRVLIAAVCTLAIAAGAVRAQSPDGTTDDADAALSLSEATKVIEQLRVQAEEAVSEAIARGDFAAANAVVGKLRSVLPGSDMVTTLEDRIEEMRGLTVLTEQQVQNAIAEGDFGGAEGHVNALAREIPSSPRLNELRGLISEARALATVMEHQVSGAIAKGDFASAEELVRQLFAVSPGSPLVEALEGKIGETRTAADILEHEVRTAVEGGEFDRAMQHVDALRSLTPEDSERIGLLSERIEQVRTMAQAATARAQAAIERGDFDAARQHAQELAGAIMGSLDVHRLEERIRQIETDVEQVVQEVREALGRGAFDDARTLSKRLGDLAPKSSLEQHSEHEIRRVQENAQALEAAVRRAIRDGSLPEATRQTETLARLIPNSTLVPELREDIAQARDTGQQVSVAIRRGDFDEARRLVKELGRLTPGSPQLRTLEDRIDATQGRALNEEKAIAEAMERGDLEMAQKHVRSLASVAPDAPRVQASRETIARVQELEAEIRAAVEHGGFDDARTLLMELKRLTSESSPQVLTLSTWIESSLAEAERVLVLLEVEIARGDFERAREQLKALVRVTPHSTRISIFRDRIESVQAMQREALAGVQAAIAKGDFEQAGQHLGALKRATPDSPWVVKMQDDIRQVRTRVQRIQQQIAQALREADFEGARRRVQDLADLTPDSPLMAPLSGRIDEAERSSLGSGRLVEEAIAAGNFDTARRHVQELMQRTPDSPQVQASSAMIAAAEADVQRIVESVHQAIASGQFDTALTFASELGEVVPASARRGVLEDRILRDRSKAKTADEAVLNTIEQALAAIARGDHDARHGYVDEAREQLKVLSAISPLSPRVTELNERIDRAALIPAMVKIESGEMRIRRFSESDRRDDGSYRTIRVNGFWIGTFEVTFDEYDRFVADTNRPNPDDEGWGRGQRPVVNVSWNEANEYTKWLSEKLGERYRLPTAEEWEYAARATSKHDYPWGSKVGRNKATCDGCGSRWDDKQTAPVGSFEPNAWGLHDVIGNVCEWTCSNRTDLQACEEFRKFDESEKGEKTTTAVVERSYNSRICGGGSWDHKPQPLSALSNSKPAHAQAHRAGTIGIRLLRCAPESDHCR